MSVPYRLFVSKLMPTDGWEHPEQPVTDSPLPYILQVLHRMSSAKLLQTDYVMSDNTLWLGRGCGRDVLQLFNKQARGPDKLVNMIAIALSDRENVMSKITYQVFSEAAGW